MSEQPDISQDKTLNHYGDNSGDYKLIVTLHRESDATLKVRYFIQPTWDGANIESMRHLPKTPDNAYLIVDQAMDRYNVDEALSTLNRQHRIVFAGDTGRNLQETIAHARYEETRKKPPRDRSLLLARCKNANSSFELSVVVRLGKGSAEVTYYLMPLTKRARQTEIMKALRESGRVEPYGYPLQRQVSVDKVTKSDFLEILTDNGLIFNPNDINDVYTAIDEYRMTRDSGLREKSQTDFSNPVAIDDITHTSADGKYALNVKLKAVQKPLDGLPYLIQYYVKATDGLAKINAELTLEREWGKQKSLSPDGAHLLFEHAVNASDDLIIANFFDLFERKMGTGFNCDSILEDIHNFKEAYLNPSFATALQKMPPKPGIGRGA